VKVSITTSLSSAVVNREAHFPSLRRAGVGKVSVIGVDLAARPELSDFAHEILLWRDRFTAAEEERDDVLAVYPYLGTGHEYLEKCRGLLPT
jgi:hypothetical protein